MRNDPCAVICDQGLVERGIGITESEVLQVTDPHGDRSSEKNSDGSPYYRIAQRIFLLLFCGFLDGFGITGIYRLNEACNNQSYEAGNERGRKAIIVTILIIGWSAAVYDTILF